MKTIILILSVILTTGIACNPRSSATADADKSGVSLQPPDFQKMITAKVYVKPGTEADFIMIARVMIENSNKEEGCMGYMLYQDPYEKTNFIFVERYKNQAAIDAHFATPYFKEFGTKIADMTSKPMEIKIFDIAGEK